MRYWLDTEFIERPGAIDLISIGLVAEDGRELYLESNEVDWAKASPWVLENVKPHLHGRGVSRTAIRDAIADFTEEDEAPEFWGYCSAYDWVVFCWLFGTMMDLPFHYPYFCCDIAQLLKSKPGATLPEQTGGHHNALADARWTRDAWRHLSGL